MIIMDATGPIFLVLVVSCLFYLVPRRLTWRIPTQEEADNEAPLRLSAKTVHSGVPEDRNEPTVPSEVSTILTRRAGRRRALRLARQAEKRRQVVFFVLMGITVATVPFVLLTPWVGWWVPVGGGAICVAWLVLSHIEARRMQKQLDAIVADTELDDSEETIAVSMPKPQAKSANKLPDAITEKGIVGPNGDTQLSLWDPITVVDPSYISAPRTGRTVRTIDLVPTNKLPVTADGDEESSGRIAI